MGLSPEHNLHVGKRAPSRRRLRQIGEALADPTLVALAESDLYWDEITAIAYLGEQQVYDLTVPETHNFIADDMLVHNTSFCLSIAQNAAKRHGTRVAFFSLEMSNDQLVQRLLAMETGIDSHRLRLGNIHEEEWPILLEAANMLANTHIFIDDTPAASVNDIRTKARRLYAEDGIDLIIIDYMQLMTGQSGGNGRNENRQQEISYISRSLKTLARELNVPVIALSQLSRAVESRSDKRPMLSDLRESGCLTGETLVTLANGQRQPIASLAGESDFEVFGLNTRTWKLEKATVSQAFCTGMKPVYKLTTALGRTIRATANHQFLTIQGWKRLDELQPDERIALPREIKISACPTMTEAELALLGHLIGDGCTLPRHAIQYTTREHDLACTVAELATKIFGNEVAPRIKKERTWYQVYLSSTRRHTHGVRSIVAEWLDELSVWGLKSYEKFVPEKVFQQPAESIAIFLRHLWVTDGSIKLVKGQNIRPIAFYASSSQRLARDVQTLLMRLGINSTVKQFSQSGKGRDQFHVTVTGKEDIGQFVNRIGTIGQYKSEAVTEIVAYNADRKHNTNRDVIPSDIWEMLVKPQMKQSQLTHRLLHERLGMSYAGMTIFKQNVSRSRALRVAEAIQSSELKLLAESDVYWDSVVRVEADGTEPVYDLTVPGNHNFVANDIIVHNSIEQDADVVLFIYREDYYIEDTDRQNIADILVTKHRHGATGTVSLYFRKELTQFRDLEIQRTELDY
jgi:replicative DNA helicase